MPDLYQNQIDTAERMIRERGRPVDFIEQRVEPPNDGSDDVISDPITHKGVQAVILMAGVPAKNLAKGQETDEFIESRQVLVAGASVPVPLRDDMLCVFNGKPWKITRLRPLDPGGAVIYYEFLAVSGG